jgi:SAM-dependent methyltransferase
VRQQIDVKSLFKEDKQIYFDFSQAPILVRRRASSTVGPTVFKKEAMSRWMKAQDHFYVWTKDRGVFTKEYIENSRMAYDALFRRRGFLTGKILDIGGGWGLYRQWWQPGESDVFVVHDPGIARFLDGPHKLHYEYYQKAFSLPLTFVEGFGEEFPYKDNTFDTCLIAAALDHCICPREVCAEAYRCLRPGGTILVIQSCYSSQMGRPQPHIFVRLLRHLRHPKRALGTFYNCLFHASHHLHRFSQVDVVLLLQQVSFSRVCTYVVPTLEDVYAFDGIKEPPDVPLHPVTTNR